MTATRPRYGEAPREIDLFPARKGDGSCMMFIHGGYWRSRDKNDFSFLAPAWVDAGVSLAVVNYDLCPQVTVEEIVRQMLRASRWLWLHAEDYGMDQDRLYVGGHSAGGHLTAMLMSALWPTFDRALPKDLWKGGLAISGLYDLQPLLEVDWLNSDLRLGRRSGDASRDILPTASRALSMSCVGAMRARIPPQTPCSAGAGAVFRGRPPMPAAISRSSTRSPILHALFAGARADKLDR